MSDMKCPFCGAELQEFGGGDFPLLHYCDNINCNLYHIMGQYTLWQELIRTRKALDVARNGLEYIFGYENVPEYIVKHIRQVLDQIRNETALTKGDDNE